MTEAEWQAIVVELAHILGWRHLHVRRSIGKGSRWVTATNVAWPDLALWHPTRGGFLVAELKTDTGKLTTEQVAVLDELRTAGVETHVWRPRDLEAVKDRLTIPNRSAGKVPAAPEPKEH